MTYRISKLFFGLTLPPPSPTLHEHQFYGVTSGFTWLSSKFKCACHGSISLHVNFHNNRTMLTTILWRKKIPARHEQQIIVSIKTIDFIPPPPQKHTTNEDKLKSPLHAYGALLDTPNYMLFPSLIFVHIVQFSSCNHKHIFSPVKFRKTNDYIVKFMFMLKNGLGYGYGRKAA